MNFLASSELSAGGNPGSYISGESGYYFIDDKFYQIEKTGGELVQVNDKKSLEGKKINFYPKVKVSSLSVSPDKSNSIKVANKSPALDIGNMINVGITSQIIDSIVYNNLNYVTYDSLPSGATVYLGDQAYTKNSDYLQSNVIYNQDMVRVLATTDLQGSTWKDTVKTVVGKTIGYIPMVNKSSVPSSSNLAEFITDAKIGSGVEDGDFGNTLMYNNKGELIIRKFIGYDRYSSGSQFDSYCMAFKLDNTIRFRSLDDSNSKFTLVNVVNKNSEGFLEKVPYFVESLSYADHEGLYASMDKSLFKPSDNVDSLMEKFLDLYRISQAKDLVELVKYWIRLVCSVLCVTNIIILMLRRSPIDVLVRDLKYSDSAKYNIDLYKIFTAGFQNVDVDIPIWRGVLVSGVLVLIASLATIGKF